MREMGLFPQPFKNKGFLKTILHFILHKTKIQQKNIQRAGNRFRRKCKNVSCTRATFFFCKLHPAERMNNLQSWKPHPADRIRMNFPKSWKPFPPKKSIFL